MKENMNYGKIDEKKLNARNKKSCPDFYSVTINKDIISFSDHMSKYEISVVLYAPYNFAVFWQEVPSVRR